VIASHVLHELCVNSMPATNGRKSKLEELFLKLWKKLGDKRFKIQREYCAIPNRRFKMDFAWVKQRVAVEIQGGTYMGKSAHNTGKGLSRDYEKNNLAIQNGWVVIYLDSKAINNLGKESLNLVNEILRRRSKEIKLKSLGTKKSLVRETETPDQRRVARRPAQNNKRRSQKKTGGRSN
jgi:very-short-patch-repair endonuclease